MIKSVAHVVVAVSVLVPAIASADEPVTTQQAGTVVVVTPQAPVVVSGQPQAATEQEQDFEPPAMAPVVAAEPQAQAVPQNQPWTNVSHINGTVVPVGEQNRYLYDFKKTTIATNPIGWIFGFWGVSVSHALSNNIAIRVDANVMSIGDEAGYEVGVSLPIYFRRTFSGPFVEPGIIARGFKHDDSMDYGDCLDCSSSTSRFVGPEMLFGWQWMFDSGWNVAMAFGAARSMDHNTGSSDDIEPAGYFRIGYGF